jgi:carbamoylphosphate synthase large subunit
MENIDPLVLRTGQSVVVVSSQTLSSDEYKFLRSVSIDVARHFRIIGTCGE